jgi:hypothetical protein
MDPADLVEEGKIPRATINRLHEAVRRMGKGELPEYWAFVRAIPLPDGEKINTYALVLDLAVGHGDAAEARKILGDTFGSGELRTKLMLIIYSDKNLDLGDLARERAGLQYPDERAVLDRAVANKLIYAERLEMEFFGEDRVLGKEEREAIAMGLRERLSRQKAIRGITAGEALGEAIQMIGSLAAKGSGWDGLMAGFLSQAGWSMPFEVWNRLGDELGMAPEDVSGIRETVAESMARKQPGRALDMLTKDPGWAPCLTPAIVAWLRNDSRAAGDWLKANTQALSPGQQDALALGNVRFAIANGEIGNAREWEAVIRGEALRKQAADEVSHAVSKGKE